VAHMAMAAASYSYRKKNDKSAKKTWHFSTWCFLKLSLLKIVVFRHLT
jgi:hypothetical protein